MNRKCSERFCDKSSRIPAATLNLGESDRSISMIEQVMKRCVSLIIHEEICVDKMDVYMYILFSVSDFHTGFPLLPLVDWFRLLLQFVYFAKPREISPSSHLQL